MTSQNLRNRKIFVTVVGWMAICVQIALGQATARQSMGPPPSQVGKLAFDVATIKPSKTIVGGMGLGRSSPDSISLVNVTAKSLIANAYGIKQELISGGQGWVGSSEYDIEAKVVVTDTTSLPRLNRNQIRLMMQTLLADRFQLVAHTEIKEIPIYELTIAKGGPKLQQAKPGDMYPNGIKGPDGRSGAGMMRVMDNKFTGQGIPISGLVDTLSLVLHRTVVDKTGLTAKYDIALQLPPAEHEAAPISPASTQGDRGDGPTSSASPDVSGPSLFTLLDEQLGLRLNSAKGPGKILVIDHIEKPSEN